MPDVTTHTGRPIPTPAARSLTTPVRKRYIKVAREEQQKKKKKVPKGKANAKEQQQNRLFELPVLFGTDKKKRMKTTGNFFD